MHSAQTQQSPTSPAAKRLAVFFFLVGVVVVFTQAHVKWETATVHWDFQQFYIAAQMLKHGDASRLYDFRAQVEYQARYVDATRIETAPDYPFLYPAATALLFFPTAWMSRAAAYALWTGCNMWFLFASTRRLQRELGLGGSDWLLFSALFFLPVPICLLHGQLSLLLLFLYTHAFALVRRERLFLAGFLVGLAALKFQLMVGFVLILLLRKAWKFVAGAAVGGFVVAAISALVIGWRQLLAYPAFLHSVAYHPRVGMPRGMVNIRGLLDLFGHREPAVWLVAVLSAIVILSAAWFGQDVEVAFALALIAAVVTAYHAYPQEISLLILPIAVAVRRMPWRPSEVSALLLVML
ncbi:MAG: DUF2029 domain-containing protein, partial [Acidobacteriia bacterium]|nr:DUF2029 domain-containing protein [Terriglobia bacterium]